MPPLAGLHVTGRPVVVVLGRVEDELPARAHVETRARGEAGQFVQAVGRGKRRDPLPVEPDGQGDGLPGRAVLRLAVHAVEIDAVAVGNEGRIDMAARAW